jgi:lipoprotein-releasing system permease protein
MSSPIVKIGITGIALGVAVMIITMAVVTGFQQQIINKITTFTSHLQINDYDENQSLEPNPISLDVRLLKTISSTQNVKHLQAFATKNGILKTKTENEGIVLKGVSSDYDWSHLKPYFSEGSPLQINNTSSVSKDIIISQTLANKLNLKLNQKLLVYFMTKKKLSDTTVSGQNYINYEPRVKDFYVKGIFNTGFSDFDKNLVFVDLKQIQKLNYWDSNQVAGYEVYLNDFNQLETSVETLNDVVGYNYTVASVKQLQSSIFSWLEMIDVNAVIIITLMIIVAAINMISALLILIIERTNLIGILKALGSNNTNVRAIFFHISVQLLLKGLLIGNMIGIGLCYLQLQFGFAELNSETYYLEHVPINLSLIHIVLINIGTIITCLIMMLLPTLIINKITPIKAIRFS